MLKTLILLFVSMMSSERPMQDVALHCSFGVEKNCLRNFVPILSRMYVCLRPNPRQRALMPFRPFMPNIGCIWMPVCSCKTKGALKWTWSAFILKAIWEPSEWTLEQKCYCNLVSVRLTLSIARSRRRNDALYDRAGWLTDWLACLLAFHVDQESSVSW